MKRLFTNILICFLITPMLQAQLIADAGWNKAYCGVDTLTLGGNPTAQGGLPPYAYNWTLANGLPATAYLNNTASGNPNFLNGISSGSKYIEFVVTVTDSNNTIATDTVKVSFTTWSCVLQDCIHYKNPGDSVTLSPRCSSNFSPMNYQWFPPVGLSATQLANPRCATPVNTRYYVHVVDSVGCARVDSCDVYVWPTSVKVVKKDVANTFPQPLTKQSRLTIPTHWRGSTLSIYTMDGKIICRTTLAVEETFLESLIGHHAGLLYYSITKAGQYLFSGKWERL